MPQSFASIHLHIIFSTKDRAPMIDPDLAPRLFDYIGGIVRERGCKLIEAGGMPDHVHLLVSVNREVTVSGLVRDIKANSSAWVHEIFPGRLFAWQSGYGSFSVSQSLLPSAQAYIQNQTKHHATMSFQDQFLQLLRKHQIEFDERYVWD